MPSKPQVERICTICKENACLTCVRCKDAKHCSRECQRTDWAVHKLLCSSLKDFTTPPTPNMRRAILFKHEAEKPEFIWLKTFMEDEDFENYDEESLDAALADPKMSIGHIFIVYNPIRNKHSKNEIDVRYNDDQFLYRPPVRQDNKSLLNLLLDEKTIRDWLAPKPRAKSMFPWRGNIICYDKVEDHPTDITRDLDTTDLRDIIDYFSVYTEHRSYEDGISITRAKKVKDVHLQYTPRHPPIYTSTLYPKDHPWTDVLGDPISKEIHVDLRYFGNNLATINCTLFASNTHVFRLDGKDFFPEHLEFLMFLASDHLNAALQKIRPTDFRVRRRHVIAEVVKRDNWNKLWAEFKTRKGLGDDFPDLRDKDLSEEDGWSNLVWREDIGY